MELLHLQLQKTHASHGKSHHPSSSHTKAKHNDKTNVENMDSIAKDDEQDDDLKTEAMADLEKAPPRKG